MQSRIELGTERASGTGLTRRAHCGGLRHSSGTRFDQCFGNETTPEERTQVVSKLNQPKKQLMSVVSMIPTANWGLEHEIGRYQELFDEIASLRGKLTYVTKRVNDGQ